MIVGSNEENIITQDLIDLYSGEIVEDILISALIINDKSYFVNYYNELLLNDDKSKSQRFIPLPFSVGLANEEVDSTMDFDVSLFQTPEVLEELDEVSELTLRYALFKSGLSTPITDYLTLYGVSISYKDNFINISGKILKNYNLDTPYLKYTKELFPCI